VVTKSFFFNVTPFIDKPIKQNALRVSWFVSPYLHRRRHRQLRHIGLQMEVRGVRTQVEAACCMMSQTSRKLLVPEHQSPFLECPTTLKIN